MPWLVPALATFGSLFSAAYCFRLIGHVFLGPVRDDYPAKPHDPGMGSVAAASDFGRAGRRDRGRAFLGGAFCETGDGLCSGRCG